MTVQQFFAALVLAVCVALLVYQGLGARRQARVQGWWHGVAARAQRAWARWRSPRPRRRKSDRAAGSGDSAASGTGGPGSAESAEREAADLIERARRQSRSGEKVVRPRFGDRRRDLH
ncbi:MAG: hypothetical protein KIT17_09520 [Rubrivivax sp.]|nr:hypothetical protein [Rubrivivax sp.]